MLLIFFNPISGDFFYELVWKFFIYLKQASYGELGGPTSRQVYAEQPLVIYS